MSEPPEKKDAPPADKTAEASPSETTGLDKTIQELIGQKLRSEYNAIADKPAYLGDPMLPPEMEDQITKLGITIRAHETGIEAVEEALKNIGAADDDETSQEPSKNPSKP
jgi:hypothetical protein